MLNVIPYLCCNLIGTISPVLLKKYWSTRSCFFHGDTSGIMKSWNLISEKLDNMLMLIFKHKQNKSELILSFLPEINKKHCWSLQGRCLPKPGNSAGLHEVLQNKCPKEPFWIFAQRPWWHTLRFEVFSCVRTNAINICWMLKMILREAKINLPL